MAEARSNTTETNPFASRLEATAEFIKRLCLAESLGRIYSVTHPKGKAALQDAFNALESLLGLTGSVPISMVEGKILVAGLPVEERNPLVRRFVHSFQQLYVDSIVFKEGLTLAEFEEFFRLVLQGAKVINSSGGLAALLQQQAITNVQIQRVSYTLVHEDEKVVKRDAVVVDSVQLPPELADRQIVQYMVEQVMQKAEQRQWLLNRIKNSPAKMADLITEGIELALSRAEAGLTPEKTIEGLLENIKLVCQSMVDAGAGAGHDQAELQHAIIALENEVRARSKKLMSNSAAVGFVNELLAVIARYADQVRSEKISAELLKDEQNLRRVERLVKKLTPQDTSVACFIERIRGILLQKGVTPEQLEQLIVHVQTRNERPQPSRKKTTHKPIADAVRNRLITCGIDPANADGIAGTLCGLLNREIRACTAQLEQKNRQLHHAVDCFQHALSELGYGVVIWDEQGVVIFADEVIEVEFGVTEGAHFSQLLRDCLKSLSFPVAEPEIELLDGLGLGEHEKCFLSAVERAIRNDDGVVVGVLTRPTASADAINLPTTPSVS